VFSVRRYVFAKKLGPLGNFFCIRQLEALETGRAPIQTRQNCSETRDPQNSDVSLLPQIRPHITRNVIPDSRKLRERCRSNFVSASHTRSRSPTKPEGNLSSTRVFTGWKTVRGGYAVSICLSGKSEEPLYIRGGGREAKRDTNGTSGREGQQAYILVHRGCSGSA